MKEALLLVIILLLSLQNYGQKLAENKSLKITVDSLIQETQNLVQIQQWQKAIETIQMAKTTCEKAFGIQDTLYAHCLNQEGSIYFHTGQYNLAAEVWEGVKDIRKEAYGLKSKEYAESISHLGLVYQQMGKIEKSIPYHKESIAIMESIQLQDNPAYPIYLNNLGLVLSEMGNYEKALPLFLKGKSKLLSISNGESPYYFYILNNISRTYSFIGEYRKALAAAQETLQLVEKLYGKKHYTYGLILNNIGSVYMDLNENESAYECFSQALIIMEPVLTNSHPQYIGAMVNLGKAQLKKRDYEKSLETYELALGFAKSGLGETHPVYYSIQVHLASYYETIGEYSKAVEILKNTITNFKTNINAEHPRLTEYISGLAILESNYDKEAQLTFNELLSHASQDLINHFSYMPASNQLTWIRTYSEYQKISNSYYYDLADSVPDQLMEYNIKLKGLVASNQTNKEKFTSSENLEKWLLLKRKISREISKPIDKISPKLTEWEEEASNLEAIILSENASIDLEKNNISISKIKSQLKENEIIIDIAHFNYVDRGRNTDSVLYVAYLVSKNLNSPKQVLLFEERQLLNSVSSNENTSKKINQLYSTRGLTPRKKKSSNSLTFIWKPLLPFLEKYTTIHISPSGLLNKTNLGAIPISKDILVSDKYNIIQYSNLRSILRKKTEDSNYYNSLIIGGVDYNYEIETLSSKGQEEVTIDSTILTLRNETLNEWNYLPGTLTEVQGIEPLLQSKNYNTTLLTKKEANESLVKEILTQKKSPKIVHFSTHGFFFPDEKHQEGQTAFKSSDNPMIRSGLVLSGANYAWKKGVPPPGEEDDGVLTALEVSNLNLSNTELVVLSACETGLGDIEGSEGVMGLQRAFKIAGARYIIMSLWQVPDEATQRLMTTFYTNWLKKGMDIRAAFRGAQKQMRLDYDDPYFWAGFVLVE